jgi:anti-anti-sigma factor
VTLLATVSGERRGANAIARVDGEIDASNVWWVEERLHAPLTNRCQGLAVDLTGTTYLDSAGIAMLFGLAKALQEHQQQLRLVVAEGSSIARMVGLAGLDGTIPTHRSLEAALADAGAG